MTNDELKKWRRDDNARRVREELTPKTHIKMPPLEEFSHEYLPLEDDINPAQTGPNSTNLTMTTAIALWGHHPLLLVGGETDQPASEVAWAMSQALPKLIGRRCAETEDNWRRAGIPRRRHQRDVPVVSTEPDDPVLEEPEHPVGCAELAHNGIVAAENIHTWNARRVAELYVAAAQGRAHRKQPGAPEIRCNCRVTASITGCKCPNRAEHCECSPQDKIAAEAHLWRGVEYFLFDITCPGPAWNQKIDMAELADAVQRAKRFSITTREQLGPNARIKPESGKSGWTLTPSGRDAMNRLRRSMKSLSRTLQLARSAADIDEQRRIDRRHVDIAISLNQHLRDHESSWNGHRG